MEKGFSLVEVLIAILILTLGVFPFMDVINQSTKSTLDAKRRFIASHYAKELIEEIKLKRFDKKNIKGGEWSDIGSDSSEDPTDGRLNDWDDVDDYDGYDEESEGIKNLDGTIYDIEFYRQVSIKYVDDNTLEEFSDETEKSNTKRVIIRCFSNENGEKYSEFTWYIQKN